VTIIGHRPAVETPEDTTPHPKAHMGGNQVMGFSNSATVETAGLARVDCDVAAISDSVADDQSQDNEMQR
jgi:hypothetical protein